MIYEVDGLGKLIADLTRAQPLVKRRVGVALGRSADRIRDAALASARAKWGPLDTTTIEARREAQGDVAGYVFLEGGGAYQEAGTARIAPNPVLGPAVDALEDSIVDDVARSVVDGLL